MSAGYWRNSHLRTRSLLLLVCVSLTAGTSGCAISQYLARPLRPRCVLPPTITEQQLVAWLNQQTEQIRNWRSTDVRITSSSGGIPIRLSAVLAVERPANFRMMAKSIAGREADLGSNQDQFWFWMRRSEPKHVFSVQHENMRTVGHQMQIPFEPDWLMQVLGVMPLPQGDAFLQPREPDSELLALVIEGFGPSGEPTRRIIQVDSCYGRIISQSLHDAGGNLLARATFNDYKVCGETGVMLPHRIDLDWPQTRTAMSLHMGSIELNNPALPQQLWTLPEIPGFPEMELGRNLHSQMPAGAPQGYIPHGAGPYPQGTASPITRPAPSGTSHTRTASFEEPQWDDEGSSPVQLSGGVSSDEPDWADAPTGQPQNSSLFPAEEFPAFRSQNGLERPEPGAFSAEPTEPGRPETPGLPQPFPGEPAARIRLQGNTPSAGSAPATVRPF